MKKNVVLVVTSFIVTISMTFYTFFTKQLWYNLHVNNLYYLILYIKEVFRWRKLIILKE